MDARMWTHSRAARTAVPAACLSRFSRSADSGKSLKGFGLSSDGTGADITIRHRQSDHPSFVTGGKQDRFTRNGRRVPNIYRISATTSPQTLSRRTSLCSARTRLNVASDRVSTDLPAENATILRRCVEVRTGGRDCHAPVEQPPPGGGFPMMFGIMSSSGTDAPHAFGRLGVIARKRSTSRSKGHGRVLASGRGQILLSDRFPTE